MPDNKRDQDVVVRLMIFSGRPNPEWPLDPDQAGDLAGQLREIIGGESVDPPEPSGLGYSGFLLQGLRNLGAPTDMARVFRSVVSEGFGAGPKAVEKHWRDRTGLEPWLLSQARSRDLADVLDAFGASGSQGEAPA